jgi:hypothetical protein
MLALNKYSYRIEGFSFCVHVGLRKPRKLTTGHVKSTYVAEWAKDGLDVALGQADKEVGDVDLGGSHCLLPGGAVLLGLRKGKKYKFLTKRSARNNRHTRKKTQSKATASCSLKFEIKRRRTKRRRKKEVGCAKICRQTNRSNQSRTCEYWMMIGTPLMRWPESARARGMSSRFSSSTYAIPLDRPDILHSDNHVSHWS